MVFPQPPTSPRSPSKEKRLESRVEYNARKKQERLNRKQQQQQQQPPPLVHGVDGDVQSLKSSLDSADHGIESMEPEVSRKLSVSSHEFMKEMRIVDEVVLAVARHALLEISEQHCPMIVLVSWQCSCKLVATTFLEKKHRAASQSVGGSSSASQGSGGGWASICSPTLCKLCCHCT